MLGEMKVTQGFYRIVGQPARRPDNHIGEVNGGKSPRMGELPKKRRKRGGKECVREAYLQS